MVGKSARRREKNAKKANEGNLAKAQVRHHFALQLMRGAAVFCPRQATHLTHIAPNHPTPQRGKASAQMPLPNAPKASDYKEQVPRSLRRIMALKQTLEQQQQQRRERQQHFQQRQQLKAAAGGLAQPGAGSQPPQQANGQPQQQANGQPQQKDVPDAKQQPQQQQNKQQQHKAAGQEDDGKQPQQQKGQKPKQQKQQKQEPEVVGGVWDQPKKLKQRKKDYLNKKKNKKRGKALELLATLHEKVIGGG
jgi:hypothetical protein